MLGAGLVSLATLASCARHGSAATQGASPAGAPVSGGAAPATPVTTPASLRTAIDSIVRLPAFRGSMWGVLVVDAERGDTLYSLNAEKLFVPASNQKLVTAAAALELLGPEFRFRTRFATSGTVLDSTLTGDIIVSGNGDPSFSDRIRGDALAPLREMADSLRVRGIVRVEGRLRRGPPVFTDAPIGYGWAWDDLSAAYGATVGDLMFNDAFTLATVTVQGLTGNARGAPPRFRNLLEALDAAIGQRGIALQLPADWDTAPTDSGTTTLFTYDSPPLRELLPHFGKASQNQMGEILLKTLGLAVTGHGRADSGARIVSERLRAWGADTTGYVVRDGSGLSRHNLLSPETIVRVLDVARRAPTSAEFLVHLPVAGVDGTLERRLRGTPAERTVLAKTGSMDRVRALSGYARAADGRPVLFALLVNGWTARNGDVDAALDTIVARTAALHLHR